jgi:hypothetical protein
MVGAAKVPFLFFSLSLRCAVAPLRRCALRFPGIFMFFYSDFQ